MILFHRAADLSRYLSLKRGGRDSIGFVPTMGALHQGHLSLIEQSKKNNNITVASIFVNPTQFNDPGDYAKYPRTIENDIRLLENSGCGLVFLPDENEIYPPGEAVIQYKIGALETLWEGRYRPGHFQGVCRVVHKLLNIVQPDRLYLGQKDYQQCMVVRELITLTGIGTTLEICPTLREASGLAMSSRNMRLNAEGKEKAVAIYQTLSWMKNNLRPGDLSQLFTTASKHLTEAGFTKTDYITLANAQTLEEVQQWDGNTKLVAIAAAFMGEVRLIDNLLIN